MTTPTGNVLKLVGGRWVPAIPEPYPLLFRLRCACGRKFWTRDGYDAHYALAHVLNANPPRALIYTPDFYTDGMTPLMCREVLAHGDRFCELPVGHPGPHCCRATEHRHGAASLPSGREGQR